VRERELAIRLEALSLGDGGALQTIMAGTKQR